MMAVTAVIGAQWGDEGKGKLVHLLSQQHDYVLRYQGGANAGHTIQFDGQTFKFQLLPSGILLPNLNCVLCDGIALNPVTLCSELESLTRRNVKRANLFVSRHAHLVLPFHVLQDQYFEEAKGEAAIGTTRRGIGPAYADKFFRVGIRAGDMLLPDFEDKVKALAQRKNVLFEGYYAKPALDPDAVWAEVKPTVEVVAPLVTDAVALVRRALAEDARIMLEGAQGTLLDIDYGTYPYVTSSHPISAGALLGTGLSWRELGRVIGVAKAYTTRVGAGPFPTEDKADAGQRMGQAGAEFGTVTGRQRRCGWLDLCLLRYSAQLNGFTELALTKSDVLDSFDEIKVCIAYDWRGQRLDWPDLDPQVLQECTPIYETLPGWACDTSGIRHPSQIPPRLADYISVIEAQTGVRIAVLSVGPDRDATIELPEPG
jgi:adenylosuccinate synthase